MPRTADLLHQLADEHRDLAAAARSLRQPGRDIGTDAVRRTTASIVEHELAHRLLVHPLLRRETWGQRILTDRREEQLLLAERLRRLLAPGRSTITRAGPPETRNVDATEILDLQLTEHTDREEILDFPHLRHVTTFAELSTLGELRGRLGAVLRQRLEIDRTLTEDGRWATAPRRELAQLVGLDEDIIIDLPSVERAIEAERAGSSR
ncbi:MAG: hypothetical protein WEB03_04300 [Nitriliruptor sp.]|uniref:hypothetical protein n=1 Tax=Nitriliruptor sp. TaxID=2448056 RepID=UPI0034A0547D